MFSWSFEIEFNVHPSFSGMPVHFIAHIYVISNSCMLGRYGRAPLRAVKSFRSIEHPPKEHKAEAYREMN